MEGCQHQKRVSECRHRCRTSLVKHLLLHCIRPLKLLLSTLIGLSRGFGIVECSLAALDSIISIHEA